MWTISAQEELCAQMVIYFHCYGTFYMLIWKISMYYVGKLYPRGPISVYEVEMQEQIQIMEEIIPTKR
jgi:hypothetical protein